MIGWWRTIRSRCAWAGPTTSRAWRYATATIRRPSGRYRGHSHSAGRGSSRRRRRARTPRRTQGTRPPEAVGRWTPEHVVAHRPRLEHAVAVPGRGDRGRGRGENDANWRPTITLLADIAAASRASGPVRGGMAPSLNAPLGAFFGEPQPGNPPGGFHGITILPPARFAAERWRRQGTGIACDAVDRGDPYVTGGAVVVGRTELCRLVRRSRGHGGRTNRHESARPGT
jgi:hypothetical protein